MRTFSQGGKRRFVSIDYILLSNVLSMATQPPQMTTGGLNSDTLMIPDGGHDPATILRPIHEDGRLTSQSWPMIRFADFVSEIFFREKRILSFYLAQDGRTGADQLLP
jgi:hypothetical protein